MRMTKTPYRLGLDIGSTTVKAVVLDRDPAGQQSVQSLGGEYLH